jgi:tyrosine-protein kinase Etk/Wzc
MPANENDIADDRIDLAGILGTIADSRREVICTTLLTSLIALGYAAFATPIYQATAVIQVEQKVPDLLGLNAITQTIGASASEATTEIVLMTSRSTIGQAVDRLNFTTEVTPQRFPLVGGFVARRFAGGNGEVAKPWMGLSRYDWGNSSLVIAKLEVPDVLLEHEMVVVARARGEFDLLDDNGAVLLRGTVGHPIAAHGALICIASMQANPGTRFDVVRNRRLVVINRLQSDISAAEQGKGSGIIALAYEHRDPLMATALLKEISELYVEQNIGRNASEAASSLRFVREQLPKVRLSLESANAALSAFQANARSVDMTLQTKSIIEQEAAIDQSLQELRKQRADLEQRYTVDHPSYKALTRQVGQLEEQRSAFEKQISSLPDVQQKLLRLERDVQVSNVTYTGLLAQAQQLEVAQASKVGNVRIVDPAAADVSAPAKPKRPILILGGALFGIIIAVAYVFFRRSLKRGIEAPEDIEHLGIPVYASIPLSQDERRASSRGRRRRREHAPMRGHLLVVSSPADLAAEALRSLRTSLHFARMEAKNNIMMISGSSPQAGKTFVSANLAAVIAQSGQRVLLIDGDMRKGALHEVLGGKSENGLSEIISGQMSVRDATRTVDSLETMRFIARGRVPVNPSELLMNPKFGALLSDLSADYDLIIIDTPPILAVTDAAVIGQHAAIGMLVVRFGLNQSREIFLALQRFSQNGVELKGAILNAVEKRTAGYYSYGYYEYASAD